jgi:uncharacterized protein YbjT (DUF2867 family)
VLEWAGLNLVILRVAALFHENIVALHSRSIREHGMIRNSFGTGKIAWISAGDAAELALSALLHPERFSESVYYAKGSEDYSHGEIAELLTEFMGRPIRYDPVDQEQWRQDLLDLSSSAGEDVVNPAMAQHISAVGHMVAQNGRALPADPEALRSLTGRDPVTMRDFLMANFAQPNGDMSLSFSDIRLTPSASSETPS